MKEISKEEHEKKLKKKPVKHVFKDPKNHVLEVEVSGNYESTILFCQKCNKGYQLTKREVEAL